MNHHLGRKLPAVARLASRTKHRSLLRLPGSTRVGSFFVRGIPSASSMVHALHLGQNLLPSLIPHSMRLKLPLPVETRYGRVPLIYSLSVAPGTQTLLGARSLVLGWVSTLTYWRPPLFLGTARKTR
jgi:hypothetical protein